MNKPSRLSVRIITRREPPPPVTPPLWRYWLAAGAVVGLWWGIWQVLS